MRAWGGFLLNQKSHKRVQKKPQNPIVNFWFFYSSIRVFKCYFGIKGSNRYLIPEILIDNLFQFINSNRLAQKIGLLTFLGCHQVSIAHGDLQYPTP